jgi:MFS family permease
MGTLSIGYSQRLTMRFGARRTLVPGLALVALGLGLFTQVPVDGSYLANVLPAMVLMGGGIGTAFPALMQLSMSGATPRDAGLASGLVNTTMQVGGALGLALLATFAATRTSDRLAAGDSQAEALTSGYRLAFVIGTALVVAAVVIALVVLQPESQAAKQAVRGEPAAEGLPEDDQAYPDEPGAVRRGGLSPDPVGDPLP